MANNLPGEVTVPVSSQALAQSTMRNNSTQPGSTGAIRTLPVAPMTHAKPTSGDEKQY